MKPILKPAAQTGAFVGMTERGVPPKKAVVKVYSTRKGWLFVVVGAAMIAGAFAFVIYTMHETKGAPSVSLLVFAALLALPGAYFILAGGHLISGDAMEAAEKSGGVITRTAAAALRIARVKDSAA